MRRVTIRRNHAYVYSGRPDRPASEDSSTGGSAGAPAAIDPCQLITSAEASSLAGASYTAGVEEATGTGGNMCVYGSQTTNVFMVLVAQAPDAATAQANWAQYEAEAQGALQKGLPPGVNVNFLANDASLDGYDQSATAVATKPEASEETTPAQP